MFHFDNAREYYLRELSQFFSEHGIIHQFIMLVLHNKMELQSQVTTLIKGDLRIVILHAVPQPFWSDVVLIACYLVNIMLSLF